MGIPESVEEELYRLGFVFLAVAAVWIPLYFLYLSGGDIPKSICLVWFFFGIYCPGCGGTRSVTALLHGHLLQALWYHPLVPYMVGIYLVFMLSWTAAKLHLFGIKRGIKYRPGYLYGMVAIIVVNFIGKNILKFCFGIVMI